VFVVPKSISVIAKKVKLYKRSRSNVWQTEIKLQNGKRERFSTGFEDEEEAKEKALELFYGAATRAENKLPQSTRRFRNVAKFALKRMQDELDADNGKTIYSDYIRVINNYLIPFFGNYDVANVNVKLLKEYEAWRDLKMGRAKEEKRLILLKGKSAAEVEEILQDAANKFRAAQSTINTHNSALNRVFDEAMLNGWITESIKPNLLNKGVKSESRGAFTQEEYNFILRHLDKWKNTGHRKVTREIRELLSLYVGFLAGTGIRHGTETYNLKWRHIRKIEQDGEPPYIAINVDGKRGKRELIATDETAIFLLMLHELNPRVNQLNYEDMLKEGVDEYVFVNRSGERVTTDALRGAFRKFLDIHNLRIGGLDDRPRSLYSLRHTYATKALVAGRDIHKLAVQMGTSVAMLEEYYSKVSARMNAAEHAGRK
jgi:integrase